MLFVIAPMLTDLLVMRCSGHDPRRRYRSKLRDVLSLPLGCLPLVALMLFVIAPMLTDLLSLPLDCIDDDDDDDDAGVWITSVVILIMYHKPIK